MARGPGRPRTRTDREIQLKKLWDKLARSTFAIVDYDLYINKYRPKLTPKEARKLKKACSIAMTEAMRLHNKK